MAKKRRHDLAVGSAAALWGFAEATLFFIVPDVLLSFIGLRCGARSGAIAGLCAAIGAGCGGAIMFLWSANDPAGARDAVLAVPAISEAMVQRAETAMTDRWILATFLGPLSATPFKVFAILAPHAGVGWVSFAGAGVLARLPRFLLFPLVAAGLGQLTHTAGYCRRLAWAIGLAWLLFYAVFFVTMPA